MAKRRKFSGASVFRYLRKQAVYLGAPEDVVNGYKVLEIMTRMGNWQMKMSEYSGVREAIMGILKARGVPKHDYGRYLAFGQKYYKKLTSGATRDELDAVIQEYSDLDRTILGEIRAMLEASTGAGGAGAGAG
mgnify:CR=1 FL=1